MAGIFNLFGSISNLDNVNTGQVAKPLSRSNTVLGIGGGTLKSSNQSKPKGLSFRSNSDLNVSNVPNLNQDFCNKQQDYLKPNVTQFDNNGCTISPHKELKKQNFQFAKPNNLPTKKIFEKHVKPSNKLCFKICPVSPNNIIKNSYPTPEKLAPYHDMQFDFDDFYTATLENEFRELLTENNDEMLPYEDEGFESDLESLNFELPTLCTSPIFDDEEWEDSLTLDLPDLSDDEIF